MNNINKVWIKILTVGLTMVMLLLTSVSCDSMLPKPEEALADSPESWQVGEHWQYSPQSIWGDTFVGVEYIFGDGLEGQFISI